MYTAKMTKITKAIFFILLFVFIVICCYNIYIHDQNNKILAERNIGSTENLTNLVSMYSLPPTTATRIYAFSILYREESLKSKLTFLQKISLDENYTFCADKRIVNLLVPFIFENDNTPCTYTKQEDMIFAELKQKFERSQQKEDFARINNTIDFSGKDNTKWFQENSIIPPVTPYAGAWETFSLNINDLKDFAPPVYGSEADLKEVQNVKEALKNVTESQKEKVEFWAAGKGSATPLGIWLDVVDKSYSKSSALEVLKIKRDVSIVAYDSVVACWNLKFKLMTKRPFMRDDKIISQIMTPNFPSYPSGHATMSGAIATILEEKYSASEMQGKFYNLAEEAANSRLWGGIHFNVDNQDGLVIGQAIANSFLQKF